MFDLRGGLCFLYGSEVLRCRKDHNTSNRRGYSSWYSPGVALDSLEAVFRQSLFNEGGSNRRYEAIWNRPVKRQGFIASLIHLERK